MSLSQKNVYLDVADTSSPPPGHNHYIASENSLPVLFGYQNMYARITLSGTLKKNIKTPSVSFPTKIIFMN